MRGRGVGMATTLQRLQAVTVQDVVLVTVCVLSVYLLRVHQALLLTPVWKKHVPVELYHNGRSIKFINKTQIQLSINLELSRLSINPSYILMLIPIS